MFNSHSFSLILIDSHYIILLKVIWVICRRLCLRSHWSLVFQICRSSSYRSHLFISSSCASKMSSISLLSCDMLRIVQVDVISWSRLISWSQYMCIYIYITLDLYVTRCPSLGLWPDVQPNSDQLPIHRFSQQKSSEIRESMAQIPKPSLTRCSGS